MRHALSGNRLSLYFGTFRVGIRGWALALPVMFFFGMMLMASPVCGYVLKGPHVLELMIDTLSGNPSLKTLRVEQRVIIEDSNLSESPLELSEVLTFQFPNRFRSDVWFQDTHRILLVSGDQALTVIDGQITSERESRFDHYKNLLLYHSRQLLLKSMLADGIDIGLTSFGRMDDRLAIVVGAQYPDESASQVWIDKERFVPLRWITPDPAQGDSGDRLEFVYRNWQKWDGVWWPSQIASYHNRQLIRQIRTRKVEADIPVPEQLMAVSYLRSIYPRATSLPAVEPPKNEMDEVRETIDEFRKKFEN